MKKDAGIENFESIRNELEQLSNDHFKLIFLRFGIILSIILGVYTSARKMENEGIENKLLKLKVLYSLNDREPESDNFFIQILYLNRVKKEAKGQLYGFDMKEFKNDTAFLKIQRNYSDYESKIKGIRDSIAQLDSIENLETINELTGIMSSLEREKQENMHWLVIPEQESTIESIESISENAYQFNIPLLGVTVDLRYGLFLAPLLFILTEMYLFLMRIKSSLLAITLRRDNNDSVFTTNYTRQPYYLASHIIRLLELISFTIFFIAAKSFFELAEKEILYSYIIALILITYCAMVISNTSALRIKPDVLLDSYKKPFVLVFYWIEQGIFKIISMVKKLLSISLGTLLTIVTLFLAVGQKGCKKGDVKGYEFFSNYNIHNFESLWWAPGDSEGLTDLTATNAYMASVILCITAVFITMMFYFQKSKKRFIFMSYKVIFIILVSCFFILSFQFSHFGSVLIALIPFIELLIVIKWIYLLRVLNNSSKSIYEKRILKIQMLAIILPFIVSNIIYFYIYFDSVYGQLVLYIGLLFSIIGSYKFMQYYRESPLTSVTTNN